MECKSNPTRILIHSVFGIAFLMRMRILTVLFLVSGWTAVSTIAGSLSVFPQFLHYRNAEPREWSHFPEKAAGEALDATFDLSDPDQWTLLTLRQAETKQAWILEINGRKVGQLIRDHNDQETSFQIPPGLLREKGNELRISTTSPTPDDVRLGQIELHQTTLEDLTGGLPVEARVVDESGEPLPCRFTIVDAASNTLVLTSEVSDDRQAVRSGVIYALDGRLSASLRSGRDYRIHIGRGFEYERLDFGRAELNDLKQPVTLHRQVKTPGLVACDTHLHTLEFAGHGDCTLIERLISIAGEGVELPISTEHDKHIDYRPESERIGVNRFFTPMLGCEVTTHQGHFNSFPIERGVRPAEHHLRGWPDIFRNIFATGAEICILNHPRDVHRNFCPLDPVRWDVSSGRFTDGRRLEANAFELINSGATQTDPMQLAHDWMALLRSGHRIAAVGSSDSHTVNFAIPGQGRTYLPLDDSDPSSLDLARAVEAFHEGDTHVSFGLLARLNADNGEFKATISGPDWTTATSLTLFVDGREVETIDIPEAEGRSADLKFTKTWNRDQLNVGRGSFLVVVARGPGIIEPWWMMMPPYQPDSPDYDPYVFAVSPALFVGE